MLFSLALPYRIHFHLLIAIFPTAPVYQSTCCQCRGHRGHGMTRARQGLRARRTLADGVRSSRVVSQMGIGFNSRWGLVGAGRSTSAAALADRSKTSKVCIALTCPPISSPKSFDHAHLALSWWKRRCRLSSTMPIVNLYHWPKICVPVHRSTKGASARRTLAQLEEHESDESFGIV